MALDLYNKFYNTSTDSNSIKIRRQVAKESAIICVGEIIKQVKQEFDSNNEINHFYDTYQYEYYQYVIKELEKL